MDSILTINSVNREVYEGSSWNENESSGDQISDGKVLKIPNQRKWDIEN